MNIIVSFSFIFVSIKLGIASLQLPAFLVGQIESLIWRIELAAVQCPTFTGSTEEQQNLEAELCLEKRESYLLLLHTLWDY